MTVRLRDGRSFTRRVDHACGHARNPMSDELVERKFHTMADPRIGRERADRVVQWAWNLEKADRVDDVFPLLEVRA